MKKSFIVSLIMIVIFSMIGINQIVVLAYNANDLNDFEQKYSITYYNRMQDFGMSDFTLPRLPVELMSKNIGVTRILSYEELTERFSNAQQIVTMYKDTVFKDEFLLVINWAMGSPGIDFRVTSVNLEADVNIELTVDTSKRMAITVVDYWAIVLKVPINVLDKSILISYKQHSPNEYPEGTRVTGRIRSYNPSEPTDLTLLQGGKEIYKTKIEAVEGSGPVAQVFVFDGVELGTYDLVVTKQMHLSYTLTDLIVGSDGVDLTKNTDPAISEIAMPCGDIDGNGYINSSDLSQLILPGNYNKHISEAGVNPRADLYGTGWINSSSLSIIILPSNYNKANIVYPYR